MPKLAFLLPFLFLLAVSAQNSKFHTLNPASFKWKRVQEKNCSAAHLGGSSFPLIHGQGNCSPFRLPNSTWIATLLESIRGDANRYRAIMRKGNTVLNPQDDADVPVASGRTANTGNYIIKLLFGTPGQSFYTVIDTGSDVAWIPCAPCSDCSSQLFQPSQSSTFKYLSCDSQPCQNLRGECENSICSRTQRYGDGSHLNELLSSDTVTMGSQPVPEFVFGCANSLSGIIRTAPGLVGFGRDATSFVSQTAKLYESTFSYCLPSLGSPAFTGSLRLGKGALSTPGLQFTPLLLNAARPSFYYVGLNGISVGEERVSIPAGTLEMDQSTGKGTIIDSGTVITRLVEPAYNPMRDSFRRQLSSLTMIEDPNHFFDTCYTTPSSEVKVPVITLHFDNSMDLTLPVENTFFPANDQGSVKCLAFALPPQTDESNFSILGNYQQQNFRIVYDVAGSRLGIAPENCDG